MQSLLIFSATLLLLLYPAAAAAATFPGDVAALRHLKSSLFPSSLSPGSCVSSWNFSLDPCLSLFSGPFFTCGFRCDFLDRSNFSRVTEISLDSASYSGFLPPSVWSLSFLRSLDLPDNHFRGPLPLPPQSSPLRHLRRLSLSRNSFSGALPPLSFPSLEELFLDDNRFSGPLPLLSLPSLRRLEIQLNNLSGRVPDFKKSPNLLYLDGGDNSFTGELPASFPSSLVQISLRNNLLQGSISGELTSALPNLQVLDLAGNAISGDVPAAVFQHPSLEQLVLAKNRLTGIRVPPWWWWRRESKLVAVDLGENLLSGGLPAGIMGFMPRLSSLVLEKNRLSGIIPLEYAIRVLAVGFPPLQRLKLSGNYLCGVIPTPLMGLKEGDADVELADNCLVSCPDFFFFCRGAAQKMGRLCRVFNP